MGLLSYKYGGPLLPAAYVYGHGALGWPGADVSFTGINGPSALAACVSLPADAANELQLILVDLPDTGSLDMQANGNFTFTPAGGGTETATFQLKSNGALTSPDTAMLTFNSGVAPTNATAVVQAGALVGVYAGVISAVGGTAGIATLETAPVVQVLTGSVNANAVNPVNVTASITNGPVIAVDSGNIGAVGDFEPPAVPTDRTLVIVKGAFRVVDFDMQAQLDLCFDWSQSTWLGTVTGYSILVPPALEVIASTLLDQKVTLILRFTDPDSLYEGQLFYVECTAITNDAPPLSDTRSITIRAMNR